MRNCELLKSPPSLSPIAQAFSCNGTLYRNKCLGVEKRVLKKNMREGLFLQLRILFFFPADSGFTRSSLFFFEFAGGVTVHVVIFC
jgi:hypothetical protein